MLAFLAVDRETLMIAAFAALVVAGLIVSLGAWILLRRENLSDRATDEPDQTPG